MPNCAFAGSSLHGDITDHERDQSMLKTPTVNRIDNIRWGRELKEMVSAWASLFLPEMVARYEVR